MMEEEDGPRAGPAKVSGFQSDDSVHSATGRGSVRKEGRNSEKSPSQQHGMEGIHGSQSSEDVEEPAPSDDGTAQLANLMANEKLGPTMAERKFQMSTDMYKSYCSKFEESAVKTVLKMLEVHKRPTLVLPNRVTSDTDILRSGSIIKRPSQDGQTLELQVKRLEKEVTGVSRRIAESTRMQAFSLGQINKLELQLLKKQQLAILQNSINRIPTENDLKNLKKIQALVEEKKTWEKEADKLDRAVGAMGKVLANADVILNESPLIKRPRKVMILTDSGRMDGTSNPTDQENPSTSNVSVVQEPQESPYPPSMSNYKRDSRTSEDGSEDVEEVTKASSKNAK